tara:strand:- start:936 stop:1175 length:240 start_codon:yes stop_codon:yes gene_type:complete
MNEPEEYVVHDYSAVNKQIDELAKREREISKALRLKNRKKEVRTAIKNAIRYVILLFGLGLFAILFAYAVRLVVYSPLS